MQEVCRHKPSSGFSPIQAGNLIRGGNYLLTYVDAEWAARHVVCFTLSLVLLLPALLLTQMLLSCYLFFLILLSSSRSVALRLLQFGIRSSICCVAPTPSAMGIETRLGYLLHSFGPLSGPGRPFIFHFVLATTTQTAARQQT
ncbi:hypothetical protein BDR03DRAFT_974556, partial [Suillus americanus]